MLLSVTDSEGRSAKVTSIAELVRLAEDPDAPQVFHDIRQLEVRASEQKRMMAALKGISAEVESASGSDASPAAQRFVERMKHELGGFYLH